MKRLKRLVKQTLGLGVGRVSLLKELPRNSIGIEIGVHKGDFSEQLLRYLCPAEFHLVDPWKHERSAVYNEAWYGGGAGGQAEMDERYRSVCKRFDPKISTGQLRIHRMFSADALKTFPDEYFDWVYIDGNHLYEFVKEDLQLSWTKTKPGGFLAGDDYTDSGWWKGGVKRAVDEFVAERRVRVIKIRDSQFILRK
jgi:hypothetical protein